MSPPGASQAGVTGFSVPSWAPVSEVSSSRAALHKALRELTVELATEKGRAVGFSPRFGA